MKDNKAFLVIGLGGCGEFVVNSIRESNTDDITCLHLDVNSQIFEGFFYGYMFDVENTIINGIHSSKDSFLTVLDNEDRYPSLRDLPDSFLQNSSRPLMRASLHLFWEKLTNHLKDVISSPTSVHLVCSSSGRTGSGWVLDIASMVRSILPDTPIEISIVIDFPNNYESNITSSKCRTYWTLREFQSYSDSSIKVYIEPTIEQAIFSIMSSVEERQNQEGIIHIGELTTTVAEEISKDLHQGGSLLHHRFWRERSRTISDLVTEETKNLIAGYALAGAEGRTNRFSEGSILEFTALSNLQKHRITFMFDSISGSAYSSMSISRGYGLAIIPYENWNELQDRAFQILCVEGLSARTGQLSNLSIEAKSMLISLKSDFLNSIDELSKTPHDFHAKIYTEILPIYVEIVDEILSSNS